MKQYLLYTVLISQLVVFSGCMATTTDVADIRDDIQELRVKLDTLQNLQKNQADLSVKMDTLNSNLTALNEQIEDNKLKMSALSQRLDDIHSSLSKRMEILSQQLSSNTGNPEPTPSELYKLTYSDYLKGKYDLSIVGFRSYLEKYAGSELAPNAQYYLADSYYNKNDLEKALQQFDKVIREYAYSDRILPAKYKKALCLLELKKTEEAKLILQQVIKENPQTEEAKQAADKLKSLQ